MAQIFLMESQFDKARSSAAKALQLNPKNLRAALIMSQAMLGAKDYQAALKLLGDMATQVQDNPEVLSNLALAHLGSGQHESAEDVLQELLDLKPGNLRAITLLIGLKYRDNLAQAQAFVEKELDRAPQESGLYLLLGDLLVRQQSPEAALAAFEKAQELNPDSAQAYLAAGKLLTTMDRTTEAMAKYEAMLAQQPNAIAAHMGIASLLQADGKFEEARKAYEKVLDIKPNYAPAANNLAWLIVEDPDGDIGEALRLAMLAKQVYPDEPHIADTLGWVHYRRNSFSLAIPQFEMALRGRPGDPIITYHLALALHGNGDDERASQVLQDLLEQPVDFPDREEAQALLEQLQQQS